MVNLKRIFLGGLGWSRHTVKLCQPASLVRFNLKNSILIMMNVLLELSVLNFCTVQAATTKRHYRDSVELRPQYGFISLVKSHQAGEDLSYM